MDEEIKAENRMPVYLVRPAMARRQRWNSSHVSVCVHLHSVHLVIHLLFLYKSLHQYTFIGVLLWGLKS